MAIEQIAALAGSSVAASTAVAAAPAQTGADFGAWFDAQLRQVNQQILDGEKKVQDLASGQNVNLHDVMISLEKAKLSFELMLQVRNKSLEAYQELMRMQI